MPRPIKQRATQLATPKHIRPPSEPVEPFVFFTRQRFPPSAFFIAQITQVLLPPIASAVAEVPELEIANLPEDFATQPLLFRPGMFPRTS